MSVSSLGSSKSSGSVSSIDVCDETKTLTAKSTTTITFLKDECVWGTRKVKGALGISGVYEYVYSVSAPPRTLLDSVNSQISIGSVDVYYSDVFQGKKDIDLKTVVFPTDPVSPVPFKRVEISLYDNPYLTPAFLGSFTAVHARLYNNICGVPGYWFFSAASLTTPTWQAYVTSSDDTGPYVEITVDYEIIEI